MKNAIAVALLLAAVACGGDNEKKQSTDPVDPITLLRSVPGVVNVVNTSVHGKPPTYVMGFAQAVDHDDPSSPKFVQAVLITHVDFEKPVVAITDGYFLEFVDPSSPANGVVTIPYEPAVILGANQIEIEHRYFDVSVPKGFDDSVFDNDPQSLANTLTLHQSVEDLHAVVTALQTVYTGAWVAAGTSNDGVHAVSYRSAHPDDVVATIAYSAPYSNGLNDPRYVSFIENDGTADCRNAVTAFQRGVLARRAEIAPALSAYAHSLGDPVGVTFTVADASWDEVLEGEIINLPFVFWQYTGLQGCASIPDATSASTDDIVTFLDAVTQVVAAVNDQGLAAFEPFDYMVETELGSPEDDITHISDLLVYPTAQPAFPVAFDPAPAKAVSDWVASSADKVMLLYGQNDPWRAGAMTVGGGDDAMYVIPNGTHDSQIGDLPAAQRDAAVAKIGAWLGIDPSELTTPGASTIGLQIQSHRGRVHPR